MTYSSQQKIGRNDPCPCGSGKKYKHCCLKQAAGPDDSAWREQHEASANLATALVKFAAQHFASDLQDAWYDFNQSDSPRPLSEDEEERQIFMPYFLYDWDLRPSNSRRKLQPGMVAQAFATGRGRRLSELERLLFTQAWSQPLSFYEILRSDPGQGMAVRDVLLQSENTVTERSASQQLRPGDLAYGQLCNLPGLTAFGRLAPICIPPDRKIAMIKLRARLRKKAAAQNRELVAADLIRSRESIRTTYLEVRDAMRTPPRLTNTDGDPVLLHTLTYRVAFAHVALEALASLAVGTTKEELLDQAEVDADGTLKSVEIPWLKKGNRMHKDWENTILGTLNISHRSLTVNVNSERRAAAIQKEIDRRLGMLATHQKTVTADPQAANPRAHRGEPSRAPASRSATPGLKAEMPAEIRASLQRDFENWVHSKLPVLGGRTPLEAIRDHDGREMVESLLAGWQRGYEGGDDPLVFHPDFEAIRRLLKIDASVLEGLTSERPSGNRCTL